VIELVQEQYPAEIMMARRDFARIRKEPLVEHPYWFKDESTEYHDIYGCIGWPQRLTEKGDQRTGYAAVVAVIKDDREPEDAIFKVVEETENLSAPLLIQSCVEMRNRWGFGVHPHLMRVFVGDYRTFENVTARYNSKVIERDGDDRQAFIVSPPDDYENARAFDLYLGSLRSVLSREAKRLYIGSAGIIKNRIMEFQRDDPAIMALGGLMHTILLRTPWMEQSDSSLFQLADY